MLSEIYLLRNSLDRTAQTIAPSHPWVRPIAAQKAGGWTARVDSTGHIARIEHDDREALRARWHVMRDLHNHFPTINLKSPIRTIDPGTETFDSLREAPSDVATRVAIFRQLLTETPPAWDNKALKALDRNLHEFPRTLRTYLADPTPDLEAFATLVSRVADSPLDGAAFLAELADRMLDALAGGTADADSVQAFLFGVWNRGKTELLPVATLVVLDLDDYAAFDVGIGSPDAEQAMIELLHERTGAADADGLCAFTGRRIAVEREKFPNPTLPVIGISYLFSKNKDTPCQARYGVVGPESASVGKDLAVGLDAALRHMTGEDRREKTWMPVPAEKPKAQDLLVVYLEDMPDFAGRNAALLGGDPLDSGTYEATTAEVCRALRAHVVKRRESLLRLFVLRKEDPGRTQVLSSDVVSVSAVLDGVESWIAGARNLPPISVPTYNRDTKKADRLTPRPPSPASVVALLRRQWMRNGTAEIDVPGAQYREVYDVFLGRSDRTRDTAQRLLGLLVARYKPLFVGIGGAMHRGANDAWTDYKDTHRKAALDAAAFAGILLRALGAERGTYMRDAPFLVGRMLSLADTLHREYCRSVRGGDVPPQLLGNAHISMAIDNPRRAFATMFLRLKVYQGWAETTKDSDPRLARWAVAQIRRVMTELAKHEILTRTDDAAKVQIMLGYFATTDENQKEPAATPAVEE